MHCMRNEMPQTVTQLRDRLLQIINTNGTISNEAAALEVIAMLENTQISCEDLEETRIGKYINTVRKAASDAGIQKRAKKLIKAWQQMIEPTKSIKTEVIVKKEVSRNPSPQEQPKRSQNKQVSSKRDIPKREPPKQIPLQPIKTELTKAGPIKTRPTKTEYIKTGPT
uniref:Mediator of RNA polymerase II transcription subunit 26 n=1 Tax=Ciona savignyi TaxID=51511 RepID=H2YHM7_CIOSA